MNTRRRQAGITLLGFLLILGVVGFFAYITMRLFPVYSEYYSVVRAMNDVAATANAGTMSPEKVKELFDRKLYISYVTSIKGSDAKVGREDGVYKLRVHYEVRGPLAYNLEYIATFDRAVALVSGPG